MNSWLRVVSSCSGSWYKQGIFYVFHFFFFNGTSTTEVYTYLHTLSLHDALPICWSAERFLVSSFHHPELWEFRALLPEVPTGALICGVPLDWAALATEVGAGTLSISNKFVDDKLIRDAHARDLQLFVYRSEEHTSELQSLMRISYAVFCLKKKKKPPLNNK